jgi:RNA polymerase sigma-70 factor (ECF subfamily)
MKSHLGKYDAEGAMPTAADNSLTSELYAAYAAKLLSYISRHVRLASDAEDLLFEVFLAVIEREHALENMLEDEQRAWLWSVARNKVVDSHRQAKRREDVPLDHVAEVLDDALQPEQVMLRHEEYQLLRTHLQQLPTLQQEILYLRFTVGLRTAEIAVVLHKSEAAIRKMLLRTLNTLRTVYAR